MRIIRLRLTNFIPYFGDENEIVLGDDSRKDRNVTVNIGPTGNGKTSISRAVMWCLFGEQYEPQWETMLNTLAIEIARQMHQKSVKISVELTVEIEGDTHIIFRVGKCNTETGKRESDTAVHVRKDGVPVMGAAEEFINEKFPPVELMKYFIFDADDMLSLFESNREKTIRDHINRIVGVETLDAMSEALGHVILLYQNEITSIRSNSPGVPKDALNQERAKKAKKNEAIKGLEGEIDELERKKKDLFPKGRLSPEELRLKEVMDKQQNAENEIKQLNSNLEGNPALITDLHLLFLSEIIDKSIDSLNRMKTTKNEFDSALGTLRSTLEGKYSGVLIEEKDVMLIRRGTSIKDGQLEKVQALSLQQGSGIKTKALGVFDEYKRREAQTESAFATYQTKFKKAVERLTEARSLLRQMGEDETNKETRERIDEFLKYDDRIREIGPILEETRLQLAKFDETIAALTQDQKLTQEAEQEENKIHKKIEAAGYMKRITELTKKSFLEALLAEVNQNATDFFKGVVREDPRLSSIVVDSDYRLNVKDAKGEIVPLDTLSKGNKQIALMAFFFGLSRYLKNKLPYIIDDPLIRLDPGHDKRLVSYLCRGDQQIVMHMIPGKEYTQDTFQWLRPFINTQNWINRKRGDSTSFGQLLSSAERKDPSKFVEYDVDSL